MISLLERMHRRGPFHGARARLADFFEAGYSQVPFQSLGEIAQACDVGKATVSRFVQHLGYRDYGELKNEVREELYARSFSPARRHADVRGNGASRSPSEPRSPRGGHGTRSLLADHRRRSVRNVESTLDALDGDEMAALCADLARAKRVWVYGQRFSYGIAFNLALHLRQLLSDARIVGAGGGTIADEFGMATPMDHVVIVAHVRIGRDKLSLRRFLAARNIPYSLLTDLPPGDTSLAAGARHVLRARTYGVGAFHDYTSTLALVHALVSSLESAAPTARSRLAQAESALAAFDSFAPAPEGGGH